MFNIKDAGKKIRFYVSPYFLARRAILKDLINILDTYDLGKEVLDFGCGNKPYKNLFQKKGINYRGIDFKQHSTNKDFSGESPDIYFNEDYQNNYLLKFNDSSFDSVVSFQVLEHHKNPQRMISEISRITKDDGFLLLTCPFIWALHEEPNDYQRLTIYGLDELLKKNNYEIIKFVREGSLFSSISMLLNEYLNTVAAKSKFYYFISVILYPFFLFFQYASLILDFIFKSETIYFNQLILAKKNNKEYEKY